MESSELRRRFGAHLQSLREGKGLTQEQLAAKIGRSVDTVGNIERGINATKLETGHRLARALGIPLRDLFDIDEATVATRPTKRRSLAKLIDLVSKYDDRSIDRLTALVTQALRISAKTRSR